jgi:hypothetical protein
LTANAQFRTTCAIAANDKRRAAAGRFNLVLDENALHGGDVHDGEEGHASAFKAFSHYSSGNSKHNVKLMTIWSWVAA